MHLHSNDRREQRPYLFVSLVRRPPFWNISSERRRDHYLGWGPRDYFNRSDVQAAIHAPPTDYSSYGDNHLGLLRPGDTSVPSALGPLPGVIEKTNNVVIGGGWLDYLLLTNGTLVTIQNMTWNGKQGFQEKPASPFYVPYHPGVRLDPIPPLFDILF